MKPSTLLLFVLTASCTYAPWHYENYYPVESDDHQSGYYKSANHVMKISVISTEVEPDLRGAPYKLWINYIDHSMANRNINICNLVVTTTSSKNFFKNNHCIEIPLKAGRLVEGVEPYATSALFEHPGMQLDFDANEYLNVSFSYSLTSNNGTVGQPKDIKLIFKPTLKKGLTQPCCLPSV